MAPNGRYQPIMGFPSKAHAIIALHEDGLDHHRIAQVVNASSNYVSARICEYRKKTGRYVKAEKVLKPSKPIPQEYWVDDEDKRRMKFYNKAREGAKMALEMMNAK